MHIYTTLSLITVKCLSFLLSNKAHCRFIFQYVLLEDYSFYYSLSHNSFQRFLLLSCILLVVDTASVALQHSWICMILNHFPRIQKRHNFLRLTICGLEGGKMVFYNVYGLPIDCSKLQLVEQWIICFHLWSFVSFQ